MAFTVLTVAGDEAICDSLGLLLASFDLEVCDRRELPSFLCGGAASTCVCIILDRESLNVSCEAFLGALREAGNHIPVLLLSSVDHSRAAELARSFGVTHVVRKPLIGDQLAAIVASILQHPALPFRSGGTTQAVLPDGSTVLVSFLNRGVLESDLAGERQMEFPADGLRFLAPPRKVPAALGGGLPPIHYRDEWTITAYHAGRWGSQEVGAVRFRRGKDGQCAEFTVAVDDHWDGLGLTGVLLEQVIVRAAAGGFAGLESLVDRSQHRTLALAVAAGFEVAGDAGDTGLVLIRRKLSGTEKGPTGPPAPTQAQLASPHARA